MTEQFDPNATPFCDEHLFWVSCHKNRILIEPDSEALERRARIAEEKLRIAKKLVERIIKNSYEGTAFLECVTKLCKKSKRLGNEIWSHIKRFLLLAQKEIIDEICRSN